MTASPNGPPAILKALVDNLACQGCYGIEWVLKDNVLQCRSYYNPEWRIASVGGKGLYTTHSSTFTFNIGEGIVGRVFEKQKLFYSSKMQEFSEDGIAASIQGWDSLEFVRIDLAKDYNINTAVFLPSANGVLEFGSNSKALGLPAFFSEEARAIIQANAQQVLLVEWEERNNGSIVPVGHYCPKAPQSCNLDQALYNQEVGASDADAKGPSQAELVKATRERRVQTSSGSHTLSRLFGETAQNSTVFWPVPGTKRVLEVAFALADGTASVPNVCSAGLAATCRLLKAPIAMEWRKAGDKIVCTGHYNTEERVSKCENQFGGSRYTLESYEVQFNVGEGLVGRVFASKVSELIPDLLQMSPDAFKRAKLAQKFDVRTAVCLAVKDGNGNVDCVMEICTDHVCEMFAAEISLGGEVPRNVLAELSNLASPAMNSIY